MLSVSWNLVGEATLGLSCWTNIGPDFKNLLPRLVYHHSPTATLTLGQHWPKGCLLAGMVSKCVCCDHRLSFFLFFALPGPGTSNNVPTISSGQESDGGAVRVCGTLPLVPLLVNCYSGSVRFDWQTVSLNEHSPNNSLFLMDKLSTIGTPIST